MYREFFGLKVKPFSITPDPKFLYLSLGHKEALAHLLYGIKEGSGFVVITGEVGTGKTTILNAFLLKLPSRMPKVVIKNPHIRPENLYFLLGEAIGIPEERRSRNYLNEFEDRLNALGGAVLIVDESQGLSINMLEEIRLLSNLETSNEKLVQIMLLGQQELNDKLRSPDLRQLKQRIGVKYHILPLDSLETKDYIDHRLRVAGYEPMEKPIFTPSSLGEIYRYSRGFPRLINIVCDNVLLAAFAEEMHQVSAQLVRRVVSDLEGTYVKGSAKKYPLLRSSSSNSIGNWSKMAVIVLAVIVLAAGGAGIYDAFFSNTQPVSAGVHVEETTDATMNEGIVKDDQVVEAKMAPTKEVVPIKTEEKRPSTVVLSDAGNQDDKPPIPPPLIESQMPKGKLITVNTGDTVAELAADYYGRVDAGILDTIKDANPDLEDINLIYKGQELLMPYIESVPSVLYSVSVASYHSITEAKAVFIDLLKRGFDATIYPYVDTRENAWYRITIGTFNSRRDAIDYSGDLKDKGFFYAKPVKISMEE